MSDSQESKVFTHNLADWPNFVVVEPGSRAIEVTELTTQVVANVRGLQGPAGATGAQGPQGPAGIAGGLDSADDVLLMNLQDGQILRYSGALSQWVNSNILDGGNF